jgi:hypothetical protein
VWCIHAWCTCNHFRKTRNMVQGDLLGGWRAAVMLIIGVGSGATDVDVEFFGCHAGQCTACQTSHCIFPLTTRKTLHVSPSHNSTLSFSLTLLLVLLLLLLLHHTVHVSSLALRCRWGSVHRRLQRGNLERVVVWRWHCARTRPRRLHCGRS